MTSKIWGIETYRLALIFIAMTLVFIGLVFLSLGLHLQAKWMSNIGLAIIPGTIVAVVMGAISRAALTNQLQDSFSLRGDLEAPGLRKCVGSLTDMELSSGFRGKPRNDSEKRCYIVQTWIPNAESLIRAIDEGLELGYTFDILISDPDSSFVKERFLRMFPKANEDNISNDVGPSLERLARAHHNAIIDGSLTIRKYFASTGICIYKFGAFAWMSFF